MPDGLARAALAVLVGAAVYETALAAGWLAPGSEPGEGPVLESVVTTAALLSLVVGALACALNGGRATVGRGVAWALLPAAGAAYVLARFYAPDPYYTPSVRRASDDGLVSPWLVLGLGALALVAAVSTRARPRPGLALASGVLVLCALATVAVRLGH